MTQKFKVLVAGIPDNSDHDNVVQNLSRLFKSDPVKIEALLKKPQAVIKTDLTKEAAEKYKTALEKAGALAKVVPVAPAASSQPDLSAMRMEREEEVKPKATCPGCGYQAMTLDDPLIKAHGGEGECPRCGVVPKKIVQAQKAQAPESFADGEAKMLGAESGSSGAPIVRIALVAVVILALVGGWYFFTRDKATTTVSKPSASRKAAAVRNSPVDEPEEDSTQAIGRSFLIPPGQSQTFTLTGPVPYIHKPEGAARIDGAYGVAQDACAKHGIQVDFSGSYIYTEQFPIWTAGSEITNVKTRQVSTIFQPVRIGGGLYQLPWNPKTETFRTVPIQVNNPDSLRLQGEMFLGDVKKKWNRTPDVQIIGYETRSYTFYFFTVTFTVYVPSVEDLPAVEESARGSSMYMSFGPTKLVFHGDDSPQVLVDGQAKQQKSVSMSVYRLNGQYKGLRVIGFSEDGPYTLTSE